MVGSTNSKNAAKPAMSETLLAVPIASTPTLEPLIPQRAVESPSTAVPDDPQETHPVLADAQIISSGRGLHVVLDRG
jgi:hypothetical protein